MNGEATTIRHRMVEVDLGDGRGAGSGAVPQEGAGVLYRFHGIPVGFSLRKSSGDPNGWPEPDEAIAAELGPRIVETAIRQELAKPVDDGCDVSVCVCTRDRPELLRRCLQALCALDEHEEPRRASLEIIVVDNAPPDQRTREVAEGFPSVVYMVEPCQGLNFARNAGLQRASGQLVAYVDDDAVVDHGWLAGLLSAWHAVPEAGFFTGQVLPFELETDAQHLFEARGGFRRGFTRVVYGKTRKGDSSYPCGAGIFGTGANMAVNRSAALALGGFDEALDMGGALPGGGDLDMFYRMIRAGYSSVYDPRYLVFHQHRRDLAGLRRQYRDSWGRAWAAFAVKSFRNDPPMRIVWIKHVVWWFAWQGTQFLRSGVGRSARPPALILLETWGGLTGLMGAYDRSCVRARRIRESSP